MIQVSSGIEIFNYLRYPNLVFQIILTCLLLLQLHKFLHYYTEPTIELNNYYFFIIVKTNLLISVSLPFNPIPNVTPFNSITSIYITYMIVVSALIHVNFKFMI